MTVANNNNNNNNHRVADDKNQVAIFLLAVLEAVLNEQVSFKIYSGCC